MAAENVGVEPELGTDLPYLVLIKVLERFHQAELEVLRETADVVVALDDTLVGMGLGDVGPDGALGEPAGAFHQPGLLGEDIDEGLADGLALEFRVGNAAAGGEETVGGPDALDVQALALVVLEDVLEFVLAEETVVDEDALEAVAYGAVHQHCGYGGIDSAGKSQDNAVGAYLTLDFIYLRCNESRRIQYCSVMHNWGMLLLL